MKDKIRAAQRSGLKLGTLGAFSGKIGVSGVRCLQIFTKAQIATNTIQELSSHL